MGSWGYGPFDNDSSHDWASTLTASKALAKDIKKALTKRRRRPAEIRAAASLIVTGFNANILYYKEAEALIPIGIEELKKVLENEDWMGSWKKPATARRKIRDEIKKLETLQENL